MNKGAKVAAGKPAPRHAQGPDPSAECRVNCSLAFYPNRHFQTSLVKAFLTVDLEESLLILLVPPVSNGKSNQLALDLDISEKTGTKFERRKIGMQTSLSTEQR